MGQHKVIRKSPCHDCPFRRNATRGWTGSQTPKEFMVTTFVGEYEMPCHVDESYSDPNWQNEWESLCVGSLQMFRNMQRIPKNTVILSNMNDIQENENVFDNVWEFLDYHGGGLGGPEIAGPAEPHHCDEYLFNGISLHEIIKEKEERFGAKGA